MINCITSLLKLTPRIAQTESAKANRQDLIAEANQRRDSARNLAKLERKRKQVEAMGEKQDALETGEDLERKRAWDYSIEDNEKWDKKLARKGRRADFSFTGQFVGPYSRATASLSVKCPSALTQIMMTSLEGNTKR